MSTMHIVVSSMVILFFLKKFSVYFSLTPNIKGLIVSMKPYNSFDNIETI